LFTHYNHQLQVYANDVNMLGRSARTTKKNAEAVAVASQDIGLEANADKLISWSCLELRMQGEVTV